MIHLELSWCFSVTDNHRVYGATNDRKEDARQEDADHQANPKGWPCRILESKILKHAGIHKAHDQSNQAADQADSKTHHRQDVIGQVVGNNGCPAPLLKHLNHIATSLDVGKAIQANVNVGPLVQFLQYRDKKNMHR
jgi:hypothetical protein